MAWSLGHEPRRKISGRDTAYGVSHRAGRLGWFPGLALGQAGRVALMLCATEFELCRRWQNLTGPVPRLLQLSQWWLWLACPLRGFGDLQ